MSLLRTGNYTDAFAITPNDTTDLAPCIICCTVGGVIRVTTVEGTVVDIAVAVGFPMPLWVTRVHSTATTATGIWGMTF